MHTNTLCSSVNVPTVQQRWLVLLDLENLVGGSDHPERLPVLFAALRERHWFHSDALVIASSGRTLAPKALFLMPKPWRFVLGHGVNGADQALLDAAGSLQERVGNVVIGSGDHAFCSVVRKWPKAGLLVGHGGISEQLRSSVSYVDCLFVAEALSA
jgi:hypothetical protein